MSPRRSSTIVGPATEALVKSEARLTLPAVAAIALTLVMLVRLLVPSSPEVYFDVDPRAGDNVITSMGPAAQVVWMIVAMLVCTLGLCVHAIRDGIVIWWTVAIAAVVSVVGVWQAADNMSNLLPVMTTVVALWGGVTMHHLAQRLLVRRWVAAMLVASSVALGIQAMTYVLFEHPATI